MATLQERMALAKQHYEKTTGKKFKNIEMADYCKVSKVSIGQWLNGPTKELDGTNLIRASEFLRVNSKWLAGDNAAMELNAKENAFLEQNVITPFPISGRLIPVISWVQAGSWTTVDAVPAGTQFDEWLPPNPKCGKNGYGLIVVGESMLPDFRPTDRIYVNPDFQVNDLKTGDLVIVSCEGDKEATFKKLIVEGGNMYLQPLNPDWPEKTIPLIDGCKLVGKVVGLYRDV